ncbi:thioredoxin-like protein [Phascolomyces articulosus]|uniref:Thioredoxin-like protein n=1 Tax=Phascolomyces articulosus TaxID=60185 RepID=A0AAD5PDL1_9FUNG|nr:thioredoxin-like protein [Phascolomyces articulosus]
MTVPDKKIVLYNTPTSPYGQRVLMALKLADVEFEDVFVDMKDKEWYKEVYPEAKVPALKYGDEVIPESMVIIELLDELYPAAKIFPADDPVKKAKMKFIIRLFEDQALLLSRQLITNLPITKESFDVHVDSMTKVFRRLNQLLVEQSDSGPYFLGKEYSAIDIALAPFIFQIIFFARFLTGQNYKVLEELPRLRAYFDALLDNPVYKETAYLDDEKLAAVAAERFNVSKNMFVE